ncbi:MAG: saccharopine dehydrogenase NADP-binding domain-containing protein [Deltaproteobacteria bacterium]|nr:saccharopine dehydrogenase NADP-binding domain-containing protein [Deltaproteobacteria bacterium]
MPRDLDLVLFGATGFTGRLVADYLARAPHAGRWAIAGRNREKLDALGLGVPVIVADALDPAAMAGVARRATSSARPSAFSRYGTALVAACADAGTHYCDLTAEVHWMRAMIDAHHVAAQKSGARVVHACGFDSIPSDLGTWLAQKAMKARHGRYGDRVTAYYGRSAAASPAARSRPPSPSPRPPRTAPCAASSRTHSPSTPIPPRRGRPRPTRPRSDGTRASVGSPRPSSWPPRTPASSAGATLSPASRGATTSSTARSRPSRRASGAPPWPPA